MELDLLTQLIELLNANEVRVGQRVLLTDVLHNAASAEAIDAILHAAGVAPDQDWPFDEVEFDSYDDSFELKGVTLGWKPTDEVIQAWWALGFERCWLCYTDGSEELLSNV